MRISDWISDVCSSDLGLASFQDQRIWHHSRRMEETLNANSASLQIYLDELAKSFGGMEGAMSMLGRTIQRDAFVMTYNDVFLVMGVLTLMTVPLVIFLKLGRASCRESVC